MTICALIQNDEIRKKITIPVIIIASLILVSFFVFNNVESYFRQLLEQAGASHVMYSWISFFVLTSDILLPVPSSIVMFTNGYVLGTAYGTARSLLSVITGSVLGYCLGMFTSIGLKYRSEEKANSMLLRYGGLSILITRGIPVISETICIICGYNKMPFKKYLFYNITGYLPVCLLYAICGNMGYGKNIFFISLGCSITIAAIFWFLGRKLLLRQSARPGLINKTA